MYTGIVQGQCEVVDVEVANGVGAFTVDLGNLVDRLEPGFSVSVNGACLTATDVRGTQARFNVIGETFASTNLSEVSAGDRVNIERSLRFGDELGGHVLSGHIAGTAVVSEIVVEGDNRTMWFDVDREHMRYLLWKGWVALDGVSLTISRVDRAAGRIAVSLIPETLARTTLGRVSAGDRVNLEFDAQTQAVVSAVGDLLRDPELRAQVLEQSQV